MGTTSVLLPAYIRLALSGGRPEHKKRDQYPGDFSSRGVCVCVFLEKLPPYPPPLRTARGVIFQQTCLCAPGGFLKGYYGRSMTSLEAARVNRTVHGQMYLAPWHTTATRHSREYQQYIHGDACD